MNEYLELKSALSLLLRRWYVIVGMTLIFAAGGYLIAQRQTPIYAAKTTIFVGRPTQSIELTSSDIETSELLVETYAVLVERQPVMQGVVESLGLDRDWRQVRDQVDTNVVSRQLLEIVAEDPSPQLAEDIARAAAEQLVTLSPSGAPSGQETQEQLFIAQQIGALRERISAGRQQALTLQSALDGAATVTSKRAIQEDIDSLNRMLSDWEQTYTELVDLQSGRGTANNLNIIEPAVAGNSPVRPRPVFIMIVYSAIGLLLSIGVVLTEHLLTNGNSSQAANSQVMVVGNVREAPTRFERMTTVEGHTTSFGGSLAYGHGEEMLLIYRDNESPRVLGLEGEVVTVGRGDENDITLDDKRVSRHHARIERVNGSWRVVDLGSTNGTFLEQSRLMPNQTKPLQHDKKLQVGPYMLILASIHSDQDEATFWIPT